jgi:hypothetical protein
MSFFTLNNRYSNLYYSMLMIFSVSVIYVLLTISVYKERPTSKQMQNWLLFMVSIAVYHLVVDPSVQVNVLEDKLNNDHIAKI